MFNLSTIAIAAAFGIGFFLGSRTTRVVHTDFHHDPTQSEDSKGEADDESDGDLAAIKGVGPCKLVLVVCGDKMAPGLISAQYVHVPISPWASPD